MNSLSLRQFLAEKARELPGTFTETERLKEMDRLACWALNLSPLDLLHQKDHSLRHWTNRETKALEMSSARRIQGEPLSRIQGERGFWKDIFLISPATLDPRPETEGLIELALTQFPRESPVLILELGVGSGCLLLSLLREFQNAQGTGIDLSGEALEVSHKNAERLGLSKRVSLLQGHWFSPLQKTTPKFDLIVSNPPYIPSHVIPTLEKDVRDYDPPLALDGGLDGLNAYQNIIPQAASYLSPGGRILLEMGIHQADPIRALLNQHFKTVWVTPDLSGILRYGGAIQNQTKPD